jgi:hypothetical protein
VLKKSIATTVALAAALAGGAAAQAADDLRIRSNVSEAVHFRQDRGLSKARTTAQTEIEKRLSSGAFSSLTLNSTLRVSYDAVYDLNPTEYGDKAGGPVQFRNRDGNVTSHGAGTVTTGTAGFGFNVANNPNQGLELLGGTRDAPGGGITFGVPVRPCDVDSRGCIKDYMDFSKNELAAPELNDKLDFIRELYLDGEMPVGKDDTLHLRLGRQQVVWGRTDLFRVLDIVNPVDYSRNNIYDELQDIRIPMAMLRADYRMGATGAFDDLNFQVLWNFDKFRPNKLGQGGSPNNPLDAASFFRGMKNCWDNGCTVANFANGQSAADFPAHVIGIRQAELPEWSLSNTQLGGKVEGELEGVGFSLNALTTRSQMPSLRGGIPADNPFTGAIESQVWPNLIAFDIAFPRVNMVGGSLDFTVDPIETAFRFETAYTQGEEFADTKATNLYSESDVLRYVIGADRATFIPFLNERRAFLISGQVFGQHILEHVYEKTSGGSEIGMPDWKDNWIATLLIKGWYESDTISPQVVMARDMRARANVIEPSVEWIPSALWKFRLGANVKFGDYQHQFDDNRCADPFGATPCPTVSNGSLRGIEPLGRFRTGVIGMAHDESEVFLTGTLRF